ncbi:uncharacterized protein BT62DRAFT_626401 [Guyanagaster necrorhizus]|uniref:Uncharacterized protein n=1 Tax=Guyanagaster necrorhizus TaxID=856835 RepID=A0A9P8AN09_9AGAR|nr:uncharacterized protein BT62DRAFT_626401 [Guyanagaster necrorhizus MCA 3950]KAG7440407.1 hypothetical protein BT62DRAFT_626401 [Guyanagaster necrorhizus MCA 3950]
MTTFFHKMGHVFQGLLSRTYFSRFHGTRSVLFPLTLCRNELSVVWRGISLRPLLRCWKNWCWEPKVLQKMSSHQEAGQPLLPELIDKLIKSRYVTSDSSSSSNSTSKYKRIKRMRTIVNSGTNSGSAFC